MTETILLYAFHFADVILAVWVLTFVGLALRLWYALRHK